MNITSPMSLMALALAFGRYTSRVLRNFVRRRVTQVTLGIFTGIFACFLIVLRSIRGGETGFIPSLAVFFAFIMAIGGVLTFVVHHIASSIQASSIIVSVANETIAAIDRLFPERAGIRTRGTS